MVVNPAGGGVESGQDVIFTLERGYRGPLLRRGITILILAALFGFVASNVRPLVFLWLFTVGFGAAGVFSLVRYFWSMRFRTRLSPEGIEIRGYFDHFVPWSSVTGIEADGFEMPGRRPLAPPYATGSGGVNRGYDTVRAGNTQFRRVSRGGSLGGYRGKLATARIVRSDGRRLLLRAPLVTAWQSDPRFDDKVRLMHRWWQTYAQAGHHQASQDAANPG